MNINENVTKLDADIIELENLLLTAEGDRELVIRNQIISKEQLIVALINRKNTHSGKLLEITL